VATRAGIGLSCSLRIAKKLSNLRGPLQGAKNQDFERIGTTFHKWVREESGLIGLDSGSEFHKFITRQFVFFSDQYVRLHQAARIFTPGLEYVYYNACNNFTLQYPLLLAPMLPEDDAVIIDRKIRLVAGYIDIFIARRVWNFRTLGYSSIVYTMFNLMKDIRDKSVPELVDILKSRVAGMTISFSTNDRLRVHQQNHRFIRHMLARMTYHIEQQSGVESSFASHISRSIRKPFEIEHIWANKYKRHQDEFEYPQDFAEYRNRIGGLILLPRGFNQSLGDDTYASKVKAYFGRNMLAQTLNEQCYQRNPSFLAYLERSGLPFRPHSQFKKADLDARQELYRQICEEIWSPAQFDRELAT